MESTYRFDVVNYSAIEFQVCNFCLRVFPDQLSNPFYANLVVQVNLRRTGCSIRHRVFESPHLATLTYLVTAMQQCIDRLVVDFFA